MTPLLIGDRVILRAPRESDKADRLAAGRNPELVRLYGGDPRDRRPFTPADAEGWYRQWSREPFGWAIEFEGRCIGGVALWSLDLASRSARLAIGIFDRACWGRGLGTEAIRLVLRCAFEGLALHRVGLRVLDVNERALRAYAKCGFVPEGVVRESAFVGDEWHS